MPVGHYPVIHYKAQKPITTLNYKKIKILLLRSRELRCHPNKLVYFLGQPIRERDKFKAFTLIIVHDLLKYRIVLENKSFLSKSSYIISLNLFPPHLKALIEKG